jgi:hypothetical protein
MGKRFLTKEQFEKVNREHVISDVYHYYECSCGFRCKEHAEMDRHKADAFDKEEQCDR